MIRRLGLAAMLLVGGVAFAQGEPAPVPVPVPVPQGPPHSGGELLDREFGVGTDEFGLDRRVEMYQWRRTGENSYDRVWKAAWIDSSEFAAGHENPPELPLDGRRWWSADATLDGKPLDKSVLKALGRWQGFRPGFSRLPGNLAATFQPEGDGLISSQNPLAPEIGDLRISWRELTLPPLVGRVELLDGVWRLAPGTRAVPNPANALATSGAATDQRAAGTGSSAWWVWLLGALALALVLVLVNRRRKRR